MNALNSFDRLCVCECVGGCVCVHALDFKLERAVGKLEGCLMDKSAQKKEDSFILKLPSEMDMQG